MQQVVKPDLFPTTLLSTHFLLKKKNQLGECAYFLN